MHSQLCIEPPGYHRLSDYCGISSQQEAGRARVVKELADQEEWECSLESEGEVDEGFVKCDDADIDQY